MFFHLQRFSLMMSKEDTDRAHFIVLSQHSPRSCCR